MYIESAECSGKGMTDKIMVLKVVVVKPKYGYGKKRKEMGKQKAKHRIQKRYGTLKSLTH